MEARLIMGWQWQDGWQSNGKQSWWSNDWRNTSGSKPRAPGRRPSPSPSWGLWTCQCGNVQTGSQCKGCKEKWWNVDWTRGKQAPSLKATGVKPESQSFKVEEKQCLTVLDDFLKKLPTTDEAHTQVEGLRDLLRGRSPAQSTRQKLKNVLDKLGYQRNRTTSLKQELKTIEDRKLRIEKELLEADTRTKSLEEEQASLCFIVGPEKVDEETEEEQNEEEDYELDEAQTAAMMKRMHKGYIARMLHAEIDKVRLDELQAGRLADPQGRQGMPAVEGAGAVAVVMETS